MRGEKDWLNQRQAALHLLEDGEKRYQETLAQLQEKITTGIESLNRGEGMDGETILKNLYEV